MKRSLVLMLAAPFVVLAPVAQAEPWLCKQPDGTKRFSYEPESARDRNCVHHPIPSGNVWRVKPREPDAARGFPRVDAKTQKQRDATRRAILERELAEEKKALAEAMKQLAEQQRARAARETVSAEERLRPYREKVRVHMTNIANLEKELASEG